VISLFSGVPMGKYAKVFPVKGRTKQSFKAECDINNILARYKATGSTRVNSRQPVYGDVSSIPDFQYCQNVVIRGQSMFDALPSFIRSRFDNDPALFLAFASDPSNINELVKLGLAKTQGVLPVVVSTPAVTPVVVSPALPAVAPVAPVVKP